ncbi:hypothetical protein OF377_01970 [Ureaplasma sp. ES3154-GEN]|uniref:DUF5452 domain-containing protein n=1 Tax=Ureaplasma sp. ES3154-GEN TaxID=2984844 RepID=UPI0021E7A01F|nr:DUF5452 domain-containing protein [Ureaplasma sp. ES3154-GEN]MCV3743647.1 hypothetical protein [Ureaplasma sp. ES3154-GEN]
MKVSQKFKYIWQKPHTKTIFFSLLGLGIIGSGVGLGIALSTKKVEKSHNKSIDVIPFQPLNKDQSNLIIEKNKIFNITGTKKVLDKNDQIKEIRKEILIVNEPEKIISNQKTKPLTEIPAITKHLENKRDSTPNIKEPQIDKNNKIIEQSSSMKSINSIINNKTTQNTNDSALKEEHDDSGNQPLDNTESTTEDILQPEAAVYKPESNDKIIVPIANKLIDNIQHEAEIEHIKLTRFNIINVLKTMPDFLELIDYQIFFNTDDGRKEFAESKIKEQLKLIIIKAILSFDQFKRIWNTLEYDVKYKLINQQLLIVANWQINDPNTPVKQQFYDQIIIKLS